MSNGSAQSLKYRFQWEIIPVLVLLLFASAGCTKRAPQESLNTLNLVVQVKVRGLDPIYAEDFYSGTQSAQVYQTLLQYHYLKRPYVLAPSLIESMPEVSADRKEYTFRLRKGVLFQDDPCFKATDGKGRELTADDVVYSLKRLADPKLASSGWWILDGKVIGVNDWREKAANSISTDYSLPIDGLKALDRYTFKIKLAAPSAQFLYSLAIQYTGIVPQEAVEFYGKEFTNHGVGTGPFRLVEFNPGARIVWERNPLYAHETFPDEGAPGDREAGLLEDAGKPLPFVDRMVVQVFVERQPMWLNFLSGQLDLIEIPKDNFGAAVTPDQELVPDLKEKGIRLSKYPNLDVTRITLNMADPLIGKNKYLRQALSLAYDEEAFIDLFYNRRAVLAQGPVPPGISGYDPNFKNPYRQYNVAKAKEYLAKAGYPGGKGLPPLEFAAQAGTQGRQQFEFAQRMFAQIGVNLRVSTYSWPQLLATIKNKKAQMWFFAWLADYPDAQTYFQLFYGKNVSPGPNDSNYSNPEFDRLYEKSLLMADSPARTELYQKMLSLLVEDCPWIFGSHRMNYMLSQGRLKNYKPHAFDHGQFKYYRLHSVEKKKVTQ